MAHDPGVPVGPVLRKFRKERGLTIEETASRAKLHVVYYGDVERSKENPTVKTIDRVLAVLRRGWDEFGAAVEEHRTAHPASEQDPPTP